MTALLVIDPAGLQARAGRKGHTLSSLAAEAGVTRNTIAKIRRGESVRPSIALRLEAALNQLPDLAQVEVREAS